MTWKLDGQVSSVLGMSAEILLAMEVCGRHFSDITKGGIMVVTSVSRPAASPFNYHGYNGVTAPLDVARRPLGPDRCCDAFDASVRALPPTERRLWLSACRQELARLGYDILIHANSGQVTPSETLEELSRSDIHFHCEYDRRKAMR